MPGRDTVFKNGYRYGFNGKEIDNEPYGQGNEYDYGMRIYNPRIGRFMSVDPLIRKFPWYTPYEYAGNKPIEYVDLDGLQTPDDDDAREAREADDEKLEQGWARLKERQIEEQSLKDKKAFEEIVKLPEEARFRELGLRGVRDYGANAFGAMQSVFGANSTFTPYPRKPLDEQLIKFNKANGLQWEKEVTSYLKTNPNFKTVVNQVTLVVTGTVNGQVLSARIRVDNVAINRGDGSVSLFDAKYSVEEITVNNVTQALTGKQRDAFNIFEQGENVNVVFRGGAVKANALRFYSGQNITTKIKSVSIISPQPPPTTSGSSSTSTQSDNTTKTP